MMNLCLVVALAISFSFDFARSQSEGIAWKSYSFFKCFI